MKKILFLTSILLITNCSLNKNSEFWSTKNTKKAIIEKNYSKNNVYNSSMTFEEFEIFIKEYSKTSNLPDISK